MLTFYLRVMKDEGGVLGECGSPGKWVLSLWAGWPELAFLAMGQRNWSFLEAKEFPWLSQLLNIKGVRTLFSKSLKQGLARPKQLF